jgi:hypothetical protein
MYLSMVQMVVVLFRSFWPRNTIYHDQSVGSVSLAAVCMNVSVMLVNYHEQV